MLSCLRGYESAEGGNGDVVVGRRLTDEACQFQQPLIHSFQTFDQGEVPNRDIEMLSDAFGNQVGRRNLRGMGSLLKSLGELLVDLNRVGGHAFSPEAPAEVVWGGRCRLLGAGVAATRAARGAARGGPAL